jgi:hypothetical protein
MRGVWATRKRQLAEGVTLPPSDLAKRPRLKRARLHGEVSGDLDERGRSIMPEVAEPPLRQTAGTPRMQRPTIARQESVLSRHASIHAMRPPAAITNAELPTSHQSSGGIRRPSIVAAVRLAVAPAVAPRVVQPTFTVPIPGSITSPAPALPNRAGATRDAHEERKNGQGWQNRRHLPGS